MGSFLGSFVLPLLLIVAALLNWSLISLVNLIAFLLIQFTIPKTGFHIRRRFVLLWPVIIFSFLVVLSQVIFTIIAAIEGNEFTIADAWWAKLIGLMRIQFWRSPCAIYLSVVQLLVAFVALADINADKWRDSFLGRVLSVVKHLGSPLRVSSCLLLPAIQLVVGISRPSWVSLPFFICSCVGLVDWSLTSNFLGLFRWWRPLQMYAGFNIILLYVYQLPIDLPEMVKWLADLIGLYKMYAKLEWLEICSGLSLVIFYLMLSYIKCDLEEMDCIMSMKENHLTEQLLPSKHSFFIRESRSGVRHTNVLLRKGVFRTFCINFFTYGFPVSLFALSFWSFHFTSVCAFGLLAYVGYIIYAFPSLFHLHRLNGLLLVFILLWAVSTYIFNVAFAYLNWKLGKDMEIWEMIGLWHYPIPGFFLLAQFCLGILVAMGNLVNNSVFLYLSDEDGRFSNDNSYTEVKEDTKVMIIATIAWGLRKCSRAITLTLIFLIAMKPGVIHAVYMIYFFVYLLRHEISRKIWRCLILLCEAHFALLYILQLNIISKRLEHEGSLSQKVLLQLGLLDHDSSWDFLEIALLACFCAVHNHGFEMLFSFSAIVQHTPCPPFGFSILKAGLNKSVLMSVYSSSATIGNHSNPSLERRIASYLSSMGQKFLSMYRSCGTYIAFLTILLTVYLVTPNYISFGYIFLLLFWIIGRQLVEKTKRRLWFPLKAYSIMVFIFIYSLSIFPSFRIFLSKMIDLHTILGYKSEASLLENVWESLAILIVMQLYSYERRQSKYNGKSADPNILEHGAIGFTRRVLIWHSQKILFVALFYASLSPISAFGLVYLLGLVIYSPLPKTSRIPSKSFLIYTGILVLTEYLFQMWGKEAQMFPGQNYSDFSLVLGFQVFQPGFWGIEACLRGKVLVIAACTLQYNVFRWLDSMPRPLLNAGKWEDPCPLFVSSENHMAPTSMSTDESNNYSAENVWGTIKGSRKWNKKRILSLRKERFETQKTILKIYMKFWVENMFTLFGLEINMIAMLLASFALLNSVSMLYVVSLAACVILDQRTIRKLWPMFAFLFASVLIIEYFAIWKNVLPVNQQHGSQNNVQCHDCWKISNLYFHYCRGCWLGLVVDDSRILISYYLVFMLACLKLRADHLSVFSCSFTYRQMISQRDKTFVWKDLSFETKSMWTFLDYMRLYFFCHLLDIVLALILITGTLEYDILHLGYLCFALVFFRMRIEILKKKNKIFKYLRIYNFVLIVLSLAYQSPFVGNFSSEKCKTIDYIYEVIGFYKYDYGFRITSRSALVEIIIFMLVSLQSYMFSSHEFDYVSKYLEAEQIDAIVSEQEKKAAWKTAQLQQIRESEEKKRQRNLQVEKMKAEILNLRFQLHRMNSATNCFTDSPSSEGLRRRRSDSLILSKDYLIEEEETVIKKQGQNISVSTDSFSLSEFRESPSSTKAETPLCEITEIEEKSAELSDSEVRRKKAKGQSKQNPIISAVNLIGDGVSQVQHIGNQAVTNLASYLNIKQEDSDSSENSPAENGVYDEIESQNVNHNYLDHSSSLQSNKSRTISATRRIFSHIWAEMRSNNDFVCYCCFVLIFLWNFSLLSMVYLTALFLYALCVNTGPSYIFWVIMLIYTEIYILLQYLYQVIIQHCGLGIQSSLLHELGFPKHRITSSFVSSSLPLFLVYLFTLIQSSITAKDGEWVSFTEFNTYKKKVTYSKNFQLTSGWSEILQRLINPIKNVVKIVFIRFCRYWKSLTQGAESPPFFVQLSMDVHLWPEDGIQPDRIESKINQLLKIVHEERCNERNFPHCHSAGRVRIQSIDRSRENPNVALAVFEVIYASPLMECSLKEWYKSLTPAADVASEILKAQRLGFVEEVGFPYSIISVVGGGKREVDLYAYIFGADLAVFFLVAMFYQSVIKNNSQFLEVYQLEDQFPKEFVSILLVIFLLIVLDRIIYLCSFATGKVIFYLFNLVLFTYSVTQYAWHMESTNRHAEGLALRAIYLTKAISLALQAIQIRFGIPHKSTLYRQFLTSKVARINYLGYRLYRALPFLYELRCVLDWSCTTTSLTMYDWLKLEDIHASLYLVKCDTVLNRARHKQGQKQPNMTKFCNGFCLFVILICVIWAPMLMYSSGNPTNIANPIKDASVQVDIKTLAGKLTLYQTTLCQRSAWDSLDPDTNLDPLGFLTTYDKTDIQLLCCQADASSLWLVPTVVQDRFIQSLDWNINSSNDKMDIIVSWVLSRDRPKGKENVKYEKAVDRSDLPRSSEVLKVLNGTTDSFRIYNVYPRFLRVTGSGDVRPFEPEVNVSADLVINRGSLEWWSFHESDSSDACGDLTGPMAIIVSEETPQGILGDTLSKFSIWGLYITFVLAVGRFIRLQCSDLRMRIPYENLPSCDRLMAICEDIYAARAEGELGIEEVLYWTLVEIYRSPHILLEYTKS